MVAVGPSSRQPPVVAGGLLVAPQGGARPDGREKCGFGGAWLIHGNKTEGVALTLVGLREVVGGTSSVDHPPLVVERAP